MRLMIAVFAVVLTACGSSDSPERTDRPDRPERPTEKGDGELDDDAMRISGEVLTLRYDDGGVLFSRTADGVISAVRLADDMRFEYDPSGPSFEVNGRNIVLSSARLERKAGDTEWHRLVIADGNKTVYVVVDGI